MLVAFLIFLVDDLLVEGHELLLLHDHLLHLLHHLHLLLLLFRRGPSHLHLRHHHLLLLLQHHHCVHALRGHGPCRVEVELPTTSFKGLAQGRCGQGRVATHEILGEVVRVELQGLA